MSVENLHELLKHELGDLLFAEKTILKGLKKMIKETKDPAIRERLEQHYTETEGQVTNLESAFETIGEKAKAQKCPGILGIMEEKKEFDEEEAESPVIKQAFNLGAGMRVEHYEIAAYTSAIAVAKVTGNRECADLLNRNLAQEIEMEKFLRSVSAKALKDLQAQIPEESE